MDIQLYLSSRRKTESFCRIAAGGRRYAFRVAIRERESVPNHIAHFEIFATDVARARAFYERVFAWRFEAGGPPDMFHIVTGPPVAQAVTRGLIAKRTLGPAAPGNINAFRVTIAVDSIADVVAAIELAGGTLRSPVIEIPQVGRLVEFADTEGNVACAMQYEAMDRLP